MSNINISPGFEKQIQNAFGVPELRPEFEKTLYKQLINKPRPSISRSFLARLSPAWSVSAVVLLIVIISTLIIGPTKVYAEVLRLIGYIPGVGIVENTDGLRILEEPIKVTRDGITVSVNKAVLTADETLFEYGISGVPLTAYPGNEVVRGCIEPAYFLLPDGTQIETHEAIPANINDVVFVLPCIFNTLPDTVPTNWEIPLHFVPAPEDYEIIPVHEVATPTTAVQPTIEETVQSETGTQEEIQSTEESDAPSAHIQVEKYIETDDGYILVYSLVPDLGEYNWITTTSGLEITDASGKEISYTFNNDVQMEYDVEVMNRGGSTMAIEFKGFNVEFPITLTTSGNVIETLDPDATASYTIDFGPDPQPGQEWVINETIEIGGETFILESISAGENSYTVFTDLGDNLYDMTFYFEGEGFSSIGGGGGPKSKSLVFDVMPKGEIKIMFTNALLRSSEDETWQTTWQPDEMKDFGESPLAQNICHDINTIQTVPELPGDINGKILYVTQSEKTAIMYSNLDGTQQETIMEGQAWSALSPDGSKIAYINFESEIFIKDLSSNEEQKIPGVNGYNLHWSPDSSRIAFVTIGDPYGILAVDINGDNLIQLSNLGYESIAGWSPDGETLYYAIPGASQDGFQLKAANTTTGQSWELFILDNSSMKAPNPAISPDGTRIVYRGRDNGSLYIKSMDGSSTKLILDNPGAVGGIVWINDQELAITLYMNNDYENGEIYFLNPDTCETWHLPAIQGIIKGIIID